MRLSELACALNLPSEFSSDPQVTGIHHNADGTKAHHVFVAIRGARFDGHQFIAKAQAAGAVAVLGEGLLEGETCPLPYLTVKNVRQAMADAAAIIYQQPSDHLQVVGITGTDGKTTVSWLTRHLLRQAGIRTGMLSTVGYELSDGQLKHFPAHLSTPEAPLLQQVLRQLCDESAQAVVLEASSHALALERVRAIDWNVAIWTNFSSEHLEFHGTLENYFADKRKLIERSPFAVLNADCPTYSKLQGVASSETSYSLESSEGHDTKADWQAKNIQENSSGLHFELHGPQGQFQAQLPMIGHFNIANALAAIAAAHHLGADTAQLVKALASFAGIPGRMELIPSGQNDPRVIVDFAHTPPSLEKVLNTLRPSTTRQLWVVIGANGGLRDPNKRGPLGEVATRLADHVVLTEEDHRTTPLHEILDAMQAGATSAGRTNFIRIDDRRKAIQHAVLNAKPGDTVLLAGKGHESTLERGEEALPWDELAEARQAIAARKHA